MQTIACVFQAADNRWCSYIYICKMVNTDSGQPLSVTLVQTDLYWEDRTANLSALEEKIAGMETKTDLIILPEMFNSGFSMDKSIAEPMNLTTTKWLRQMAAMTNAMVIGSFAVKEDHQRYNRVCCVQPDGALFYSDKRHLFRMGGEQEHYQQGSSRLIVHWKGWKICPLICYDLRFPVWSRNKAEDPYDLLIYVANWPARRAYAWNTLLAARAIENQAYVVGVNRVGSDANGLTYQGDSKLLDFLGEPFLNLGQSVLVKSTLIYKSELENYRATFPAHQDADGFDIH